jgi:hypothetical protein
MCKTKTREEGEKKADAGFHLTEDNATGVLFTTS